MNIASQAEKMKLKQRRLQQAIEASQGEVLPGIPEGRGLQEDFNWLLKLLKRIPLKLFLGLLKAKKVFEKNSIDF